MKKSSKRNFLLLEVLLSLGVVTLSAVYILQNPLRYFREEIQTLQSLEYQRLADFTFSEIKESFYRHQIPLDQIPTKQKDLPFFLWKDPISCSSELLGKAYRFYQIYGTVTEGKDKIQYRLLTVKLFLTPQPHLPQKPEESSFFIYEFSVEQRE